jgi:hypothetical protein
MGRRGDGVIGRRKQPTKSSDTNRKAQRVLPIGQGIEGIALSEFEISDCKSQIEKVKIRRKDDRRGLALS